MLFNEGMEEIGCECSLPSCPACGGNCSRKALGIMYRVDMHDETGTAFCQDCGNDAFDSGMFSMVNLRNSPSVYDAELQKS